MYTTFSGAQVWTQKGKPTSNKIVREEAQSIADGQVRLKVEHFALTANNITYAVFGDLMKYWNFFPTGEDGWGAIPVWGFGTVVESKCEEVPRGKRYYGYFPMAEALIVEPGKVNPYGFTDMVAHRQEMSPIYSRYQDCETDPLYTPKNEPFQMLFRPLFTTSWLIDDFLDDNDFFGASTVVITSASSKTSMGLAWQLHRVRRDRVTIIGLTSPGNRDFVEGLGIYDQVIAYDALSSLPGNGDAVMVDMAGSDAVRRGVHDHFGDRLKYSCSVGAAHWDAMGANDDLPGPKPTLFFAPAQAEKRGKDWGQEELFKRLARDWFAFADMANGWLEVDRRKGADAVLEVLTALADGSADPRKGYVLSLA